MARIVVISDDPQTRADVVGSLDGDHDVRAVGSPWKDDASKVYQRASSENAPDVLILDAALLLDPRAGAEGCMISTQAPRPDGQASPPPAVIVLVEAGQEYCLIPCFEAGADDYLIKPLQPRELKNRVRRALSQRAGISIHAEVTDVIAISDDGQFLPRGRALPENDDEIQVDLGRYEVRGVLGRGGYGVVYRAHDRALERDVALKVLPKDMHECPEAVTRFLRESTAIARLDHPNVIKFYELGSFQGRLYYTMELVEGATLKAIADKNSPLGVKRAARYVAGIAEALTALQSIGLVHRDVKPENVLITKDDEVKLIDFGLVRIRDSAGITSEDDVLGTPYFMAPEYIRAPGIPDIRYDLYALGITFFNLLTGEYPFDGKNAAHVMEKHLRCPAPRVGDFQPGVPPLAERIVYSLLQKDPRRRLQTPRELLHMLEPLTATRVLKRRSA